MPGQTYTGAILMANHMKALHENLKMMQEQQIQNAHKKICEEGRYFRNQFAHIEGRVDDDFDWGKFGDYQERAFKTLEGPIQAAIAKLEKEAKDRASGTCKLSLLNLLCRI